MTDDARRPRPATPPWISATRATIARARDELRAADASLRQKQREAPPLVLLRGVLGEVDRMGERGEIALDLLELAIVESARGARGRGGR